MRHEASWFSPLIWLSMLGLAFVCGLVVMGQAFETRVFMFDDRSLRVSADYSAELRLTQAAPIAPVDSAVISDTVRDLIAEQEQAPLLSLFLSTPTIVAEPRPSRTATPVAVRLPPATPGPTSAIVLLPVGPGPTSPNPPVSSPGPAIDPNPHGPRATRVPTHTPTHVPTRTPLPTATPRPSNTATPRPTHTATPWPTSVPPTETPTELPPPPTEPPTEPPPPTETPTETPPPPTEPPTELPPPPTETPTETPPPPTETPTELPPPPTETPTEVGVPPSA